MYKINYAHRYLEGLTTVEIAQLIRDQIAKEVAVGQLPDLTYEVVVSEGAAHIEVTVKDYTGKVFNKRAIELDEEIAKGLDIESLLVERITLPLYDLDLDLILKAVSRLSNQWLYEVKLIFPVEHATYTCNVTLDPVLILADFTKVKAELLTKETP